MKYVYTRIKDELQEELKQKCFKQGVSMSTYVKRLIEEDLNVETSSPPKKISVKREEPVTSETPKSDNILKEFKRKVEEKAEEMVSPKKDQENGTPTLEEYFKLNNVAPGDRQTYAKFYKNEYGEDK